MPALPARSPVSDAVRNFLDRVPARALQVSLPAVLPDDPAERRASPRHAIRVRCEARRLDGSPAALRRPTVNVVVRDVSAGGVGATSDVAVSVGEAVVVHFPPRGPRRGFEARGRVVRSGPDRTGGFRLGIRFDAPTAAPAPLAAA